MPAQYGPYGVRGIPALSWFYPEGKIVAKDFRDATVARELEKWPPAAE